MQIAFAGKAWGDVPLKGEADMGEHDKITLIGSWVLPNDLTYMDDEKHLVHVEIKNNTDDIVQITRAVCSFETEDGHSEHEYATSQPYTIPPGKIRVMRITFQVGLTMKESTNCPSIRVEYVSGGATHVSTFDKPISCYAIIRPIPKHIQYFFISHKDPMDTKIAKSFDHYLKKIGFSGYIAEDNRQPGLDLWREKIQPSIENCSGLIVIWTAEAIKEPTAILREIKYAQEKNKRIMLLTDKGLDIPDILQKDNEYDCAEDTISEHDVVKMVDKIYQMYLDGVFS